MLRRAAILLSLLSLGACTQAQSTGAHPTPTPTPTRATPSPRATLSASPTTAPPPGLADVDPSITVDLRYATPHNFTGAVLPGYHANRGLARPAVAAALLRTDRYLRAKGYTLVILDAYRPVRATLAMVAWARRVGRSDLIGPYIATHSEHNLGTAVDVTLGRPAGAELDMGTPFDTLSSAAHYGNATGTALANRRLLRDAMTASGFVPYDTEWWHFSMHVAGATALDYDIR